MALTVGIDMGTSGCRAIAISHDKEIVADYRTPFEIDHSPQTGWHEQDPALWWQYLQDTLQGLLRQINPQDVAAIAIDGTSSTLLFCDQAGNPLGPALMYNDTRSIKESELISQYAPDDSAAQGPGSSLAKLMHLSQHYPQARYALHQSDWLMGRLCGQYGNSDDNNVLKMGYSPEHGAWPDWIDALAINQQLLPRVLPPGTVVATIDPSLARQFALNKDTRLVSGTTDSTAAFIATGAQQTGQAVTSLGSTLVTKIISNTPLFSRRHGVYSHKLFDHWLAGGASNSGGAALLTLFTVREMQALTPLLTPLEDTGQDFYPLPSTGERFPQADPHFQPRMPTSLPGDIKSRAIIFQGLLEGISKIEAQGYRLLETLGAPYPETVMSVGGGAVNTAWGQIRQRYLGVPVVRAQHHEAAYGAALLARQGLLAIDQSL